MKKRSGFTVMARLIGLVKPLSGYMVLAILMGLVGHLCAAFITIFGGFAVLDLLGFTTPVVLKTTFICVLLFALVRGVFRYAEQSRNHFIAFKLLALIRERSSAHCAVSAPRSSRAATAATSSPSSRRTLSCSRSSTRTRSRPQPSRRFSRSSCVCSSGIITRCLAFWHSRLTSASAWSSRSSRPAARAIRGCDSARSRARCRPSSSTACAA